MTVQSAAIDDLSITSASLQLDGEGFEGVGATWRRQVATSPFVHGEVQVHAVKDAQKLTGKIWCLGATHAQARAAANGLIDAVSETRYFLTQTVDDVTTTWTCYQADYQEGNATRYLRAHAIPVTLTIPVSL